MRQKILQYKELIQFLFIIGAIYLVMKIFLFPVISTPEFKAFIDHIGFWGYIIVIGYIVLSHVFAPISGTPALAFSMAIYGLSTGMWLLYYAGLISSVINFYISRKYGRSLIKKFIGEEGMKEVDDFTAVGGEGVLFISRLLGFSLFDFISYAAGLTNISFKSYFAITAIGSLITNGLILIVFRNIDFTTEEGLTLWLICIAVAAVISGVVIKLYIHGEKKKRKQKAIQS